MSLTKKNDEFPWRYLNYLNLNLFRNLNNLAVNKPEHDDEARTNPGQQVGLICQGLTQNFDEYLGRGLFSMHSVPHLPRMRSLNRVGTREPTFLGGIQMWRLWEWNILWESPLMPPVGMAGVHFCVSMHTRNPEWRTCAFGWQGRPQMAAPSGFGIVGCHKRGQDCLGT